MAVVLKKSKMLTDVRVNFCPGCTHGVVHRLVAEALEEMGAEGRCIAVGPVGCAVFTYNFFNCDAQQAAHGRAPAVATGAKRVNPNSIVFTYQGDGDLAAIGTAETVHAAARGENITIIFINNAIFGMTGGQMAPTTLIGQKASTAPYGRDALTMGQPLKVCEMLKEIDGVAYLERVSTADYASTVKAKKAIKKAFEYQDKKLGFTLIELLCTCPTNWKCTAEESREFVKNEMTDYFPLGVYKDILKK
jgi:2-oxoglutarate ferredoxin oxidoreductase subunit beta